MSTKIYDLTAEDILGFNRPEQLFTQRNYKSEFKTLRGIWHPDRNLDPQAKEVFIKLSELYQRAVVNTTTDRWGGLASIRFTTSDNKTYQFKYVKRSDIAVGDMYIGRFNILYLLKSENRDLFENAIKMLRKIKYKTKAFEEEFKKYFPEVKMEGETDKGFAIVIKKPENAVLLRDLIQHESHFIDPKHVAWMIGSLYNISLFLEMDNISHNSFLSDSIFVDPQKHIMYLYGGWWFASDINSKPIALPSTTRKIFPESFFKNPKVETNFNRRLIKATGIEMLGDDSLSGSRLLMDPKVPKEMLVWLRTSPIDDGIKEYKSWYDVLGQCFGERKFISYNVNFDDIYLT